jgi:hypothetical protein
MHGMYVQIMHLWLRKGFVNHLTNHGMKNVKLLHYLRRQGRKILHRENQFHTVWFLKGCQCLSQSRDSRPSETQPLITLFNMASNVATSEVPVTSNTTFSWQSAMGFLVPLKPLVRTNLLQPVCHWQHVTFPYLEAVISINMT